MKEILNDELLEEVGGGVTTAKNLVEVNAVVIEQFPNNMFDVQLEDGRVIRVSESGKLRMNYVRINVGERVIVTLNPDNNSGRITYKFKD